MKLPLDIEALETLIKGASAETLSELERLASSKLAMCWLPQDGPQSDAFYSQADELLYGGAAGGGKTDLLVGLATTQHERSLIFRRQSKDLDGLWERLNQIVPNPVSKNDVKRYLRTPDNRTIEGGHLELPGSERAWQGRPHDLIGFDEAAQLAEARVNFVLQWLRSTTPGQRKRVVMATNPPIPEIGADGQMQDTAAGDWLLRWFAPWLDEHFPNPAKPGELRWCYMIAEGDRLTTVWVDGPGCFHPETGERVPNATQDDIESGKVLVARSRTFIKSLLKDNHFLRGSGYAEKLAGTPEPLRSMLLNGDFTIKAEDHARQIIPSAWILAAQERWRNTDESEFLRRVQLVLYGDIAQGGADTTALASLCTGDYFDELVTAPGKDTPDGRAVAAMLIDERLDGSLIVLDATGGWAGSTQAIMSERHKIDVEMHKVSQSDGSWEPSGIYKYGNLRAKMWWEFRLALDPKSGFKIALPPSPRLRVQLQSPHWFVRGKELFVESKDDLRKRLGTSTDEADAVMGAWQYREQALARLMNPNNDIVERLNGRGGEDRQQQLHAQQSDDYDPREGW